MAEDDPIYVRLPKIPRQPLPPRQPPRKLTPRERLGHQVTAQKLRALPRVKDCIAYIESCNFQFRWINITGQYIFRSTVPRTVMEIGFTITELRHAKLYGF